MQTEPPERARHPGISALALFFGFGFLMAGIAALSLLWPGGPLEPMWRLNPRARAGFAVMGPWAVGLMATVSAACGAAGWGLWHDRRWAHRLAIAILAIQLVGDLVNVILGIDLRALIGVPIVAALLIYLGSRRVRGHFARHHDA